VAVVSQSSDPRLAAALSEAQAEVAKLTTKVSDLEKDVTELEQENDELDEALAKSDAHLSLLVAQLTEAGIEPKPASEDPTDGSGVAAASTVTSSSAETKQAKGKPKAKK
jgi:chromosome segregation ATPase